jgi:two-component system cell cycle sensor histidine kinase/response regulator CckA
MLAVTDTGSGMPAETQPRIFGPFFTTKEKGTGLGLSTAYGIVRQSGGYICVSSELGRGTTFRIYLPVVDAFVEEPLVGQATPGSFRGTETILVVEDDAAFREIICEFLRSSGYVVLEAGTPEEALGAASQHSGPVHFLLTDVVLPGVNGSQLAAWLAANHPDSRSSMSPVMPVKPSGSRNSPRQGLHSFRSPVPTRPSDAKSESFWTSVPRLEAAGDTNRFSGAARLC